MISFYGVSGEGICNDVDPDSAMYNIEIVILESERLMPRIHLESNVVFLHQFVHVVHHDVNGFVRCASDWVDVFTHYMVISMTFSQHIYDPVISVHVNWQNVYCRGVAFYELRQWSSHLSLESIVSQHLTCNWIRNIKTEWACFGLHELVFHQREGVMQLYVAEPRVIRTPQESAVI